MRTRWMKRAVAAGLSVMMLAGLAGCGSKTAEVDTDKVFASVDSNKDIQVKMGTANFMARYSQAMYETYYMSYLGEEMWSQNASEDVTYEQSVKDNVASSLKEMLILKANMDKYKVSLSEEDEKAVSEAAKQFMEDNKDEEKTELVTATEDVVKELLELYTIRSKMYSAMTADVDTNVTDEEALQKAMGYIHFEDDKEDEGTKTAKQKAEEFYNGLKEGKDFKEYAEECSYDPVETSFDESTTSPNEDVIKAVWALKKGGYTEIIEGGEGEGCYIAYLTSEFDKEATEAQKENILDDRREEAYQKEMEDLKASTSVTVDEKLLDDIDFNEQGVTMHQDESDAEESAGTVTAE